MKPNVELLTATLDYIEKNPEQWYQGDWAVRPFLDDGGATEYVDAVDTPCGTAMCFAGTALKLSGYTPTFFSYAGETARFVKDDDDNFVWADDEAATLLGLDFDTANNLFDSDNTLEDLKLAVNKIIEEEDVE